MKILNFLLLIICNFFHISSTKQFKLELVQVLFRHGDRVPDKTEIYKSDPYASLYQQLGYGQLTKIGKKREYQVGQILRKRYGDFLGELNTNDVYARSTDVDRTKMSLKLALAGLYPPTNHTLWNNNILWSSIPIHYEPLDTDHLAWFACLSFIDETQKDINKKLNLVIKQEFLNYIGEKTGFNTPGLMPLLYTNLRSALSLGLPLPKWCSEDDYEQLIEITEMCFDSLTDTPRKAKMTAGYIIQQFLKNINNHENHKGARKIYLYAAHDANVFPVIKIHNFTGISGLVDYGSSLVVEKLRGSDNQIYLRSFLWKSTLEEWLPLKLQNCDYECPLWKYKKMMNWVLPDEKFEVYCDSFKTSCNIK